ncbi:MAG TPA: hypothetical protein VGG44_01290 [Tepidisphaeraceae bacterium]
MPWPGIDGLGRRLPLTSEVGEPRANRFVGIFYFLYQGEKVDYGPFDATKIIAAHPEALTSSDCPFWGAKEKHKCYWGEPLYGYYSNIDPWVLRRHAHLLADAGVDTLIFDTTNSVTHRDVYMALCKVFEQVRREGDPTPQICFMVNSKASQTAQQLFDDLYKPGLYPDLWFRWDEKPLMICDPAQATPDVKAFFTLRAAHWPNTLVNTPYAWHWESIYPQVYGYTDDPKTPEEVNVAVAQNLRASDGAVTQMKFGDGRGRSFHDGYEDARPNAIDWGFDFQEQWRRAFQLDPPFVMLTGWNEWTANITNNIHDDWMFGDQFTEEYSRDIEPMQGGYGDNYYMQMITNIRRFKGMPPIPRASEPNTIDLDGGFQQWKDVQPVYRGHAGNTIARDFDGFGLVHYVNRTGRNNLLEMKVTRDDQFVYFYARTAAAITPRTDPNWMMLFIDCGGSRYIVNRLPPMAKRARLERNIGGWNWTSVADVDYRVAGDEMQVAIPRTALEQPDGKISLNFKWADNLQHPDDPMDFYVSGDTAPDGRLEFRYVTQ